MQKQVDVYVRAPPTPKPSELAGSRGEPRTPLPASSRRRPRKTPGLSQVSATGAPALSPAAGHRGPRRRGGGAPPQSRSGLEKLSQAARCQAPAGRGGEVGGGEPSRPRLQAEVGEAEESPARPALPGTARHCPAAAAGGAGSERGGGRRFFTDEAEGARRAGGRRREGAAPVRRRTPPACWASGRRRRWPAWAPPGSSCPRPSSSSGTA